MMLWYINPPHVCKKPFATLAPPISISSSPHIIYCIDMQHPAASEVSVFSTQDILARERARHFVETLVRLALPLHAG
jgi:hypothetical protein